MSTTTPMSTANTASFNGNNLTAVRGVTILGTDNYNPARRNLIMYELARASKGSVASSDYNDKAVGLRIGISRDSRAEVEASLDALLALIQEPEKNLVVKQSGGLRSYTCTFGDYTIQVSGGAYMEITLIFSTSDHFGYDTAETELLNVTGQTANTRSDLINVGGSARWQVPIWTFRITNVTGGTNKILQFGNGKTTQVVSIQRSWIAGDVVTIDPLNQSVMVNGSEVAFTGSIPEFKVGYGYATFFSQCTSIQYNLRITQYRRWV